MKAQFGDNRLPDRLWSKAYVDLASGCWQWTAVRTRTGYAKFRHGDQMVEAHRMVYIALIGAVPDGLVLDHLCRNRACINPNHLEAVTGRENTLRGVSFSAVNAAKTHCVNGHEFSPENTYMYHGKVRSCRACNRVHVANRTARLKASQ